MCILTFFPESVQPDIPALRNGADNNPDGHGYAIVDIDNSRIVRNHSMEPYTLIDEFAKLRKQLDGPALFHSRIATSGTTGKVNCHPIQVGDDPLTVVAHNGVLPAEAQPQKKDWRSDTRIFAESLLPMRNFDGRRSMKKLAHWIGGDKLVILTVNPRWEAHAYLVNSKRGEWDNDTGIWYSNQSYRDDYNLYRWHGGSAMYPRRRCLNHVTCKGWTYVEDICFECRGGYLTPDLALVECAWADCKTRTTGFYCHAHKMRNRLAITSTAASAPDGEKGTVLLTRSPDPCLACQALGTVSTVTMVCTVCYTCQDCMQDWIEGCQCYVPGTKDTDREHSIHGMAEYAEGTVIG